VVDDEQANSKFAIRSMSFVSRQRFGAGSSRTSTDQGLKYGKIEHAIEEIKLAGHKIAGT
jgi:hypothetical protein